MTFAADIASTYNLFIGNMPVWAQSFIAFFLIVIVVLIYAVFIWRFHRWISTKNLLKLNLNKHNKEGTKILEGFFYFLEYIIILPFLIFFWFAIFTLFLLLLTESIPITTILIISATIIAVVRMTAYYNETLSRDLAKLIPFTLLGVSIINPGFFNFQRIIAKVSEIPQFFNHIIYYLIFIIALEIILRLFDFIFSLFGTKDEETQQQQVQKPQVKTQ